MTGPASTSDATIGNGRVTVALTGPRWTLDRLRDYFRPWLADLPSCAPDASVRMHAGDLPDYRTLQPDGRVERLRNENTGRIWYAERYRAGDHTVYVLDDPLTVVTCDHRCGTLDVFAISPQALFWAVKDLVQRQILQPLMQQTSTIMHAAGVLINGKVVAITGAKGAGKTTVQFTLASSGAGLVSADRVYVGADDVTKRCYAWGYPARSSVDRDSFRLFPDLGTTDGFGEDGSAKVLVPLAELARRFNTSVQPGGPMGAVLFCRRGRARTFLSQVDGDMVPAALAESWFQIHDPIVPGWLPLFTASEQDRAQAQADALDILCASVPVVEISSDAVRDSGPWLTRSEIERLLDDADR